MAPFVAFHHIKMLPLCGHPMKVWNCDRSVRKSVYVESLKELVEKGCHKLQLDVSSVKVVLEFNGEEVIFQNFKNMDDYTTFMFLQKNERWTPAEIVEDEPDCTIDSDCLLGDTTLVQNIRRDKFNIKYCTRKQFEVIADCETQLLASILKKSEQFASLVKNACQHLVKHYTFMSETMEYHLLYMQALHTHDRRRKKAFNRIFSLEPVFFTKKLRKLLGMETPMLQHVQNKSVWSAWSVKNNSQCFQKRNALIKASEKKWKMNLNKKVCHAQPSFNNQFQKELSVDGDIRSTSVKLSRDFATARVCSTIGSAVDDEPDCMIDFENQLDVTILAKSLRHDMFNIFTFSYDQLEVLVGYDTYELASLLGRSFTDTAKIQESWFPLVYLIDQYGDRDAYEGYYKCHHAESSSHKQNKQEPSVIKLQYKGSIDRLKQEGNFRSVYCDTVATLSDFTASGICFTSSEWQQRVFIPTRHGRSEMSGTVFAGGMAYFTNKAVTMCPAVPRSRLQLAPYRVYHNRASDVIRHVIKGEGVMRLHKRFIPFSMRAFKVTPVFLLSYEVCLKLLVSPRSPGLCSRLWKSISLK